MTKKKDCNYSTIVFFTVAHSTANTNAQTLLQTRSVLTQQEKHKQHLQ